jgi:hypothetical protein
MNTLSTEQLIELLPPDDAVLDRALQRFELTAPVLCREPGYCRQLIAEGWTNPSQINWRGRPAFVITWHVTSDRGLWLDIAQSLYAGAPTEALVNAVETLARQQKARYIRWLTLRRGLVRIGQRNGYRPEAVLLVKPL